MEYALLGKTGMRVSRLAFGTMTFGGEADEAESARLFAKARDAGVDFFDCADVYQRGRSEEILGRLVAGVRDEVVLATKAYFPTGGGRNDRGASRYHLVRALEASLRRLGTDRVDVYYLHRFDDETDLEESLRALDHLVASGKVLYPAASNFAAWQVAKSLGLAALRGFAPLACVQPMYNLVKRQAESEILPMCASEEVGVVAYGPLAGGLLTGKYGRDRRPASGRLVDSAMYATRYGDERYYDAADELSALAAELGVAATTLAIRFAASHPAVTSVLLGARRVEQLEPLLGAFDTSISDEESSRVAALFPAAPPATDRNEERTAHNFGAR